MTSLVPSQPHPIKEDYGAAIAYIASLKSERSRDTMTSQLRVVCRALATDKEAIPSLDQVNWAVLNAAYVRMILAKVREIPTRYDDKRGPAGLGLTRAALFGVARALFERGSISADEYQRIKLVQPERGKRLPRGRDYDEDDKARLIEVAQALPDPRKYRDTAMLAVDMVTGLRVSELVAVHTNDIDMKTKEITVIGKGDKQRVVPLNDDAIAALRDWMRVRGRNEGPVFCTIDRHKVIHTDHQMSVQAAHKIGVALGLNWHDLRRTAIADYIEASDLTTAQLLAGHANVNTTAQYDKRGRKRLHDSAAKVKIPYKH